jgi:hypothetical protein
LKRPEGFTKGDFGGKANLWDAFSAYPELALLMDRLKSRTISSEGVESPKSLFCVWRQCLYVGNIGVIGVKILALDSDKAPNKNHRPASMGGACWSERWQGHLIPVKGRAGVVLSIYS